MIFPAVLAVLERFGEGLIDVISGKQNVDDALTEVEDKIHNADFLLLLINGDLDSAEDEENEESVANELRRFVENIDGAYLSPEERK